MSLRLPRSRALLAALAATILAMSAARATITPGAEQVVERYVAAIGGRAAVAAVRTTRTKATIEGFGFAGTLETWTQRPDRIASHTVLGVFTLVDGYDGTTAWRVDQNGKFSIRDGRDLEDERGSAWYENGLWLDPDQGGGSIVVQGEERDSAGAWTVLEVKGPVGRTRAMWFDARTGLLDRVVLKTDQQTITTHLSDYRPVAGILRAHRQEASVAGMPGNRLTVVLDSVWVNEAIDPARFAPPRPAAADFRFLRGRDSGQPRKGAAPPREEPTPAPTTEGSDPARLAEGSGPVRIPVRYGERHVWVRVSIDGGPAEDFILDTGASVSLLDSAWAAARGIATEGKMQAMGAGAAGDVAFATVGTIRVTGPDGDGVELAGQKLAVLALNRFVAPFFWREAAGVLGYDFISRFVMEIDYDNGSLTLHDPRTFTYQGKGTAVPITMSGSIPVVKARLDGRYEGQFRLDVGSGSTVDLHGPFVEKHGLRDRLPKTIEVLGGGFGGTFTSHIARMKRMEIGPFAWKDPLVVLSGARTGGLASEDLAGTIGNDILKRFRCTFDYEHRTLHLEPGRRFAKADRFSRAGVQLARFADTVKAMQVLAGSAAEEAGIEEGDEVVSLDGRPILSWSQDAVTELFETGAVGRRHTLEILRDGEKRRVTLRLKEMI